MDAALKRFALNGYHTTKVSDIVKDAGVAQGTFYWYFKSKEAIACEIIADGREQLLEAIACGYRRETGDARDMVQASSDLLGKIFRFAESNRYLMELLLGRKAASDSINALIDETRLAMEQAFLRNIKRAVELGMLPGTSDPVLRSAFLMSLIEGVISRWLFGSDGIQGQSAEALAAATARFEFFGLLGV